MKVKFILLFCLALSSYVFGQTDYADTAFKCFQNKDYNTAIRFYKIAISQVKYCDTYNMEMIAFCYTRQDSLQQAKVYLERAIECQPLNYMQMECCWDLAEIYLKEKNYFKAIETYKLYGAKWKNVKKPADGETCASKLFKARFLSKCYQGLKQIDSAVNVLTPYVFYNADILNPFMFHSDNATKEDTMRYDTICTEYLTLLKKLHSGHNIKTELIKADQSFYYQDSISQNHPDTEFTWENIKCGFKFYGKDVVYMHLIFGDRKNKLRSVRIPEYEKDYQLNEFRTSVLYKMILKLPDQ